MQMLVDCSYASTYDGCQGGWFTAAYDFAKANGGVPSEAAVPYVRRVQKTFPFSHVLSWRSAACIGCIVKMDSTADAMDPSCSCSGNTWVSSGSCPYTTKPRQLGSNLIKDYQLVTPQNDQGVATAVMKQPIVVSRHACAPQSHASVHRSDQSSVLHFASKLYSRVTLRAH